MRRPAEYIPEWPAEPGAVRAETCVVFLAVHGLLSDADARGVGAIPTANVSAAPQ